MESELEELQYSNDYAATIYTYRFAHVHSRNVENELTLNWEINNRNRNYMHIILNRFRRA